MKFVNDIPVVPMEHGGDDQYIMWVVISEDLHHPKVISASPTTAKDIHELKLKFSEMKWFMIKIISGPCNYP